MKSSALTGDIAVVWLALVLFVVLAIAFLLPIQPNDYWWYVRLGGDIAATHTIPAADTYSHTRAGEPVVYHSWLAALALWGTRQLGGDGLTVLLRGGLLALFYGLLWHICRRAGAGPRLSTALTLLAALAGSNNWAMRPQLFSYPLFALALLGLLRWQEGHLRWGGLLPPVVLLWVNLHGAFVLAFLLAGAMLVGRKENRRGMAAVLAAMVVAALANPRGAAVWGYVYRLLTVPAVQQLASEWQPPTLATWQGALFFGWLLAMPLLAASSPRRLNRTEWLWFLGFGWMALSSLRHVVWFVTLLALFSARLLSPLLKTAPERAVASSRRPTLNGSLALLLVTLPLALLPGFRNRWWRDAPPVLSPDTPVTAAEWLAAHPELPGPLWNDLAFSSYLIYALPERPVWIDTRFELYPLEQWRRYRRIAGAAPDWSLLLEEEGISLVMLNPAVEENLRAALGESPGWRMVYQDETAVIFVRATAERS